MENLAQEIIKGIGLSKFPDGDLKKKILERVEEGSLTREENPKSHFCVYFLPFNPRTSSVFLVHHKKANKWLAPGGHIGKSEGLMEVLNREIREELGVVDFFSERPSPFFFTVATIEFSPRPCREHFDIWFLMVTDGKNFKLDMQEFYDVQWLSLEKSLSFIVDIPNRKALEFLLKNIKFTEN